MKPNNYINPQCIKIIVHVYIENYNCWEYNRLNTKRKKAQLMMMPGNYFHF